MIEVLILVISIDMKNRLYNVLESSYAVHVIQVKIYLRSRVR